MFRGNLVEKKIKVKKDTVVKQGITERRQNTIRIREEKSREDMLGTFAIVFNIKAVR